MSAANDRPPFRADQVGSLLRPPELLRARDDFQRGRISAAELGRIEDEAIRAAVKAQESAGLRAVTDGEFRRGSWHMDFLYQIGGVTKAEEHLTVRFHNEQGDLEFTPAALRVSGRLKLEKCIFEKHFKFLQSVAKVTPKLSIPSPSMMHYRGGRAAIDPAVYPDLGQFWDDLAAAYAAEIAALAKLGCTYLQIDDTSLAYLNDPAQREYIASLGGDAKTQHLTYIRTLNAALANRPAGMTICTHSCRGNFRSSWAASGGWDYVADALFNQLEVDGFFLEYDDARSGGFEPLRFVPKGKRVVLGLVSSKRGALERKDDLKRRIEQASKFVPLEQLCLSPQCGFSSTFEGNALTFDQQTAKLRLVVETAREVWGD
ncbi:MAG TPA: 5-methyltetrahydropteroyltriglutamate--homocysteine S-methyltransferase [Candidatus Binataceae bacterium]|nr:5-methyltetrahydropteroyltriglutamate--homocysteine S-methyltransferase [Candidatus Binataceae bacterium]